PALIAQRPVLVVALIAIVLVVKALVAGGVALAFDLKKRGALVVGAALAQVGEFAFVLAQQGSQYGLLDDEGRALFITVSVATMILTPLWLKLAARASRLLSAAA